ncbi:MAG TPA: IS110 family transposase [Anaerolineales bacterium]|jgi:transposase
MDDQKELMQRRWVGIDWGKSRHAVAVVDDEEQVLARFMVGASLEDLRGLGERLRGFGPVAGIAIESTPNPVVCFLQTEGFTVYPVNPKLSRHWREGNSVAGSKSDARDGLVLAKELARRYRSLRVLREPSIEVAELAGLCKQISKMIGQRTALVLGLEAALIGYYPAALSVFSDWTSPVAWRFLKRFPTPKDLACARKDTLIRFLRANRVGLKPIWLERIERRKEAVDWPQPRNSFALRILAAAYVAQLQALEPQIRKCQKLIDERAKDHPRARLMRSLPGAGERLAPALAAMTLLVDEEPDRFQAVRCQSGVAPIQCETGQAKPSKIRRRCNKYWRCVMHEFAHCSKRNCPWARAYYHLCRERGDGYATALRKLADKWLNIINRMIEEDQPYDNERYVEALRRSASPVYQKLCGEACGKLPQKT